MYQDWSNECSGKSSRKGKDLNVQWLACSQKVTFLLTVWGICKLQQKDSEGVEGDGARDRSSELNLILEEDQSWQESQGAERG